MHVPVRRYLPIVYENLIVVLFCGTEYANKQDFSSVILCVEFISCWNFVFQGVVFYNEIGKIAFPRNR